jgi:hypothetical protein
MSINKAFIHKATIWLAVIGYLVVNVRMQLNFFAGRNIFEKYRVAADAAQALSVAQQAYFAKTGWLLLLLILLSCNVPFGLGFGLSYVAYATTMLVFFGLNVTTTIYLLTALAVLASYFVGGGRRTA